MIGANDYCRVFPKPEQIGRLYLMPSSHARGATFQIFVLPEGVVYIEGAGSPSVLKDAVEVYGITGGEPGWTETYGWLHDGPWRTDFETAYERRSEELEVQREKSSAEEEARKADQAKRTAQRLSTYRSPT